MDGQVVAVVALETVSIAGFRSRCLVTGVDDGAGGVIYPQPERRVTTGQRVYRIRMGVHAGVHLDGNGDRTAVPQSSAGTAASPWWTSSPSSSMNAASHSGWSGHACPVTRLRSRTTPSTHEQPAASTSGRTAG